MEGTMKNTSQMRFYKVTFRISHLICRFTIVVLIGISSHTLDADDALVNVIGIDSSLHLHAEAQQFEEDTHSIEWFTGHIDYQLESQGFSGYWRWKSRCSGQRNGVPLKICEGPNVSTESGGSMEQEDYVLTLDRPWMGRDHATNIAGGASASGSISTRVTDRNSERFRVAGKVAGSATVATVVDGFQRASFRTNWEMVITVKRPSRIWISNCSLFKTKQLPISDLHDGRNICMVEITDVSQGIMMLEAMAMSNEDKEFAAAEQNYSADGTIPDDFIEDTIPAEQHESYETLRKGDESEQLTKSEEMMEFGQQLDSMLAGTQLLFSIEHPDRMDEDFEADVMSGAVQTETLSASMEERFVIDVRAIEEDSWWESVWNWIME